MKKILLTFSVISLLTGSAIAQNKPQPNADTLKQLKTVTVKGYLTGQLTAIAIWGEGCEDLF
jgi:hypothetical protein